MGNKTALVTGASDGIGLEFGDILAAQGYDLVLVARREDTLNEVGEKLSQPYGINCTVICTDLSEQPAAQTHLQRT